MHELRKAIIRAVAENISLNPATEELVEAWNKMCEESPTVGIPQPINPEDIDSEYED